MAVKILLLVLLLGFAALNCYRLAPALRRADAERARRDLLRSIGLQKLTGLAVVTAASVPGGLPPAMHVQPIWPFARRLSLVALDNPDLRREFGLVLAAALAGIALAAGGVFLRRWRWPLAADRRRGRGGHLERAPIRSAPCRGVSHQLLPFAERLHGQLDRDRRGAVSDALRVLPRRAGPGRRLRRERTSLFPRPT